MSESTKTVSLRYTVSRKEAQANVGISPKQLRDWQEARIFTPALGAGSRRFTELDVQRLEFLKRLLVTIGLPLKTVQALLRPFSDDSGRPKDAGNPNLRFRFLDIRERALVSWWDGIVLLLRAAGKAFLGDRRQPVLIKMLETWLLTLAAARFYGLARTHRDVGVYQAARDELFEQLRRMDRVARCDLVEDPRDEKRLLAVLSPSLPNDPDLTQEQLDELWRERKRLLEPLLRDSDEVPF
jgi:DNA-binding transcriptional MerR regulator